MSDSELQSIDETEKPRDNSDYTGRTIEGFEVKKKLGQGTFGVVYAAAPK